MERNQATLVTGSGVRTADEIAGDALRLGAMLRRTGVQAGERVLLKADNSPSMVTAMLALMHLDVSIVLLDDRQTPQECTRVAMLTKAPWAVSHRGEAIADHVRTFPLDAALDAADPASDEAGADTAADAALDFSAWERRTDALITWSSGSTGLPKGIVRSGHALLDDLERSRERMGYQDTDVLLPLVPFSHFYGLTLVLIWWRLRCTLIVTPTNRLDQALKIGSEAGATVVDATPSTLHSILNLTERRPQLMVELATVRMWCVGGAPVSSTFAARFSATFGLPVLDGYGSNEAGNIALASLDNPEGCGRPLDGVEVTIVDADGSPVPIGSTGEIIVRSPAMMVGYLAEDGTVAPNASEDYHTQDLGYWDTQGNLYVVGRKYAVHRLGHTLYPESIERRAEACGRPVKVVALDDERRGCQLVFVVADPDLASAQLWRREIDALLPSYEQPNRVLVVDELPLNANGKPDMVELRRLAGNAMGDKAARPVVPVSSLAAADVPLPDRLRALHDTVAFLREQPESVAAILTEISVRKAVEEEIEDSITTLEGAVDEIRRFRPKRVGQLAGFMSSNILLYTYVLHAIVPSLFVERITMRPSSQVAGTTRRLHELLAPVHGLPIEMSTLNQRQFVTGPAAEANVVVFTGAYNNAEDLRGKLRRDQLMLFFGQGINPFVVGPDADGDRAIEDAIRIRLHNSGQDCFGPDVLLVHSSVKDRFVGGLTKRLAELRHGGFRDPDADYGAVYYDSAIRATTEFLLRNRDHVVHGGEVDFRTGLVRPTVLVRDIEDQPDISEFFSPLFNVVVYDHAEQLEQLLFSPYFAERSMGAMLYGADEALAEKLRDRHTVAVNRTLLDVDNGNDPFGGRGVMANYAAYNGKRTAEPLLVSKTVAQYGIGV
ncbi:aldehyde dehydrogenase family protein [Streptacidiphilus anmyonensis]|uniref:aldehyde dehydrogenase family protein n=1 Tax=Streptacidiphilus anmyonensis TaxID=405782 RepID=UPI000694946E|nr:aldehyde dehydrogenase family protein [Streptacidiphilus anmyonensis]